MKNCVNCYREIPDDSGFCPYCGVRQAEMQPEPQSGSGNYNSYTDQTSQYQSSYQNGDNEPPVNWVPYLILAIISTVCCCPPFGIVAIVYAAKINNAVSINDPEEARRAARNAKIWLIVAYAVGILAWILYLTAQVGFWMYDFY